jgi:cytochrome P450
MSFDHNSEEYALDPVGYNRAFREECPVVWSEEHGGYWVVLRYEDVATVARDDVTFSSRIDPGNRPPGTSGISIPGADHKLIPLTLDPPEFNAFRRMLNPSFSPAVVERLKVRVERFSREAIDEHIESGEIDFIGQLAWPVTAKTTLAFLGLPLDEWVTYASPYHEAASFAQGTPEYAHGHEQKKALQEQLRIVIAQRREEPEDDLITRLTQATLEGEPLDEKNILEICDLVLGGGVDTTAAGVGHAFPYIEEHPELRTQLLEDEGLMDSFCEEVLRFHAPTQALARTAMKDVEIGGAQIKAGQRVLISWASANHDPAVFDRPDEIVADRPANRHTSFGLGAHRCIGSSIARAEFKIMVRDVLTRMPDYLMRPGQVPYSTIGRINGWHSLPATFTPGRRSEELAAQSAG